MGEPVSNHYRGGGGLTERIAKDLRSAGIELSDLSASDLETIDEFHFRGRQATLEPVSHLGLFSGAKVLDIGSGLGGVARTIADAADAHVTGIDLTKEFCEAATAMSEWLGLSDKTGFRQGDALHLPFPDDHFDGAVTVHVAMNIPDKAAMYREAHRVLKSGARFGIYDILQGEGGDVLYPAPWASEPSISHLATPEEMSGYLRNAGFKVLHEEDSTLESHRWLQDRTTRASSRRLLPATTELLFADAAKSMSQNQLLGLKERRMLTYCNRPIYAALTF